MHKAAFLTLLETYKVFNPRQIQEDTHVGEVQES